MKIICAWCQKDMGEKLGGESDLITHSICLDCKEKVGKELKALKAKKLEIENQKKEIKIQN